MSILFLLFSVTLLFGVIGAVTAIVSLSKTFAKWPENLFMWSFIAIIVSYGFLCYLSDLTGI